MFRRAQLCDCCLHDLKGSAKINHQIILDRQPRAIKIAMIKAMVADGMGPFRASMCGRDWRKMIASPDIYAVLTKGTRAATHPQHDERHWPLQATRGV
jgi:hypothetical protein